MFEVVLHHFEALHLFMRVEKADNYHPASNPFYIQEKFIMNAEKLERIHQQQSDL